jgi:pullulanase
MATLGEIQKNLTFLNVGPNQLPGLIVMKLDANGGNYGTYGHVLVLFNASNQQVSFSDATLAGMQLSLHPVQQNSADAIVRTATFNAQQSEATVPALTTAVFVGEP